ncbi:MAG: hypothetical protein LBG70_00485, partial [Bifidobacteriaceae bacterium]|nr:hypothetical protein [Bifidobacteriaceae bacterium]
MLGRLIMVVAVAAAVVTGLAGCTDSVAPSGSGVSETGQVESGGVSASASVSASVSAEREEAAALLAADRLPLPEGWSADDPNLVVMSTEQAREVVEGADYQMVRIYNDTAVRPDGCLMSPNQTTLQADGSIGGMCLQAEAEDPTKTPKNRLFWNNSQGEVQFFQAPKGLPVDTIERGSGLTDARGSLVGGVDYTSDNWFVDDWRLFTVDLRTGKSRSVVDWTEICDSRYVAAMSGRETVARLGETKMFFSTHEPAKPGGRCDPE